MFLSEGISRQPLLSFLHPLNNCEIKIGGREYEAGFLISDIWQLTDFYYRTNTTGAQDLILDLSPGKSIISLNLFLHL